MILFIFLTACGNPLEMTDEKGVSMRFVPAGEFTMGSNADYAFQICEKFRGGCKLDWFMNEEPHHKVILDSFYMDKYEVTNSQYKACVEAGACLSPTSFSATRSNYYDNSQYDNYPVIFIYWNYAKTYCEWRGGNLPTEAQWEKAARGTDGRSYPWGEGIDCSKANYYSCKEDTIKVGSYENGVSPYGIYDMAGNVWEWVADWYSETYYQDSPANNPLGPDSGQSRILRGGMWMSNEGTLRTSYRYNVAPTYTDNFVGFRCVRNTNP